MVVWNPNLTDRNWYSYSDLKVIPSLFLLINSYCNVRCNPSARENGALKPELWAAVALNWVVAQNFSPRGMMLRIKIFDFIPRGKHALHLLEIFYLLVLLKYRMLFRLQNLKNKVSGQPKVFCLNWFLPVLPNHSCFNAVGNHATRRTTSP